MEIDARPPDGEDSCGASPQFLPRIDWRMLLLFRFGINGDGVAELFIKVEVDNSRRLRVRFQAPFHSFIEQSLGQVIEQQQAQERDFTDEVAGAVALVIARVNMDAALSRV